MTLAKHSFQIESWYKWKKRKICKIQVKLKSVILRSQLVVSGDVMCWRIKFWLLKSNFVLNIDIVLDWYWPHHELCFLLAQFAPYHSLSSSLRGCEDQLVLPPLDTALCHHMHSLYHVGETPMSLRWLPYDHQHVGNGGNPPHPHPHCHLGANRKQWDHAFASDCSTWI